MALTDSDVGFAVGDLDDPAAPTGWADSPIGWATTSLADADSPFLGSPIGFKSKALIDPPGPFIMAGGIPVEVKRARVVKAGVPTLVRRWKLKQAGVLVDLVRPVPPGSGDGFVDHVTIPDQTNAGVIAGIPRDAYTGPTTITTPTVIENKNITSRLVNQSQLTLINCYLSAAGVSNAQGQITNTHVNARLYAERCTFKPSVLNYYTNSVMGHDAHLYRCVVMDTVDGFSPYAPSAYGSASAELSCCLIGPLAWFDQDGGIHPDGTHNDGVQLHGGGFYHAHGCAFWGYKTNALGTPALDSSADNRYPQIGQNMIAQHTVAWIPGYTAAERALTIDSEGFPVMGTWGGAPLVHHNWFWGGGSAGIKIASLSGSWAGGIRVAAAAWIFNNIWMDYPRVTTGSTFPYPVRSDTNCYINGAQYPATSGRGWDDTTSPSFDWGNVYGSHSSIPSAYRGRPVGIRIDPAPAAVARP